MGNTQCKVEELLGSSNTRHYPFFKYLKEHCSNSVSCPCSHCCLIYNKINNNVKINKHAKCFKFEYWDNFKKTNMSTDKEYPKELANACCCVYCSW